MILTRRHARRAVAGVLAMLALHLSCGWSEPAVALPADLGGGELEVTVTAHERAGADPAALRFGAFHCWVYAAP